MGADADRRTGPAGDGLSVRGHTFWHARTPTAAVELTSETGIELDGDRCRWTVVPPGATGAGEPVESSSRDVRRFMHGVLGAMQRATHRATVRPAPKPTPKVEPPLPATAPVSCPLCRGEAWPDCELCDGAGIVSQRLAARWQDLHRG